jgi:hypothetical protein
MAALCAVRVEHALQMYRYVAERTRFLRNGGRTQQFDADVWIFGERDRLVGRRREGVVLRHGRGQTHVVDDERELRRSAKPAGGVERPRVRRNRDFGGVWASGSSCLRSCAGVTAHCPIGHGVGDEAGDQML